MKYRVHYLGGTDSGTAADVRRRRSPTPSSCAPPGASAPHALCTTHCRFYGKLSPKSKNHKILLQVKHHGWKPYKVLHTDKHSHWSAVVKPTRGKGTYYRAVVARTST